MKSIALGGLALGETACGSDDTDISGTKEVITTGYYILLEMKSAPLNALQFIIQSGGRKILFRYIIREHLLNSAFLWQRRSPFKWWTFVIFTQALQRTLSYAYKFGEEASKS